MSVPQTPTWLFPIGVLWLGILMWRQSQMWVSYYEEIVEEGFTMPLNVANIRYLLVFFGRFKSKRYRSNLSIFFLIVCFTLVIPFVCRLFSWWKNQMKYCRSIFFSCFINFRRITLKFSMNENCNTSIPPAKGCLYLLYNWRHKISRNFVFKYLFAVMPQVRTPLFQTTLLPDLFQRIV